MTAHFGAFIQKQGKEYLILNRPCAHPIPETLDHDLRNRRLFVILHQSAANMSFERVWVICSK